MSVPGQCHEMTKQVHGSVAYRTYSLDAMMPYARTINNSVPLNFTINLSLASTDDTYVFSRVRAATKGVEVQCDSANQTRDTYSISLCSMTNREDN